MEKKYFVCADMDSMELRGFIQPTNIMQLTAQASLDEESNVTYYNDYKIDNDLFNHIRFYEIYFDENGQPVKLHYLKSKGDEVECPNGWVDYLTHMEKIGYNNWFVFNNRDAYFSDNIELGVAFFQWAKNISDIKIRKYFA